MFKVEYSNSAMSIPAIMLSFYAYKPGGSSAIGNTGNMPYSNSMNIEVEILYNAKVTMIVRAAEFPPPTGKVKARGSVEAASISFVIDDIIL
jgi:hypothetical protein